MKLKYFNLIIPLIIFGGIFFAQETRADVTYYYTNESGGDPVVFDPTTDTAKIVWHNDTGSNKNINFVQFMLLMRNGSECGSNNSVVDTTYWVTVDINGLPVSSYNSHHETDESYGWPPIRFYIPEVTVENGEYATTTIRFSDFGSSVDPCAAIGGGGSGGVTNVFVNNVNQNNNASGYVGIDTGYQEPLVISYPDDGVTYDEGIFNIIGECNASSTRVWLDVDFNPLNQCPTFTPIPTLTLESECVAIPGHTTGAFVFPDIGLYPWSSTTADRIITVWDPDNFEFDGSGCDSPYFDQNDIIISTLYEINPEESCSITWTDFTSWDQAKEAMTCLLQIEVGKVTTGLKNKIPFGYWQQFKNAYKETATTTSSTLDLDLEDTFASTTITILDTDDISLPDNLVNSANGLIDIFFVLAGISIGLVMIQQTINQD